jgi:hypothetical protein
MAGKSAKRVFKPDDPAVHVFIAQEESKKTWITGTMRWV